MQSHTASESHILREKHNSSKLKSKKKKSCTVWSSVQAIDRLTRIDMMRDRNVYVLANGYSKEQWSAVMKC